MCTSTHSKKAKSEYKPKMYSSTSKKWAFTIDTISNHNNHDLGKGVMIQLGYIRYVSTWDRPRTIIALRR